MSSHSTYASDTALIRASVSASAEAPQLGRSEQAWSAEAHEGPALYSKVCSSALALCHHDPRSRPGSAMQLHCSHPQRSPHAVPPAAPGPVQRCLHCCQHIINHHMCRVLRIIAGPLKHPSAHQH
jgi:hypothetical protein